VKDREQQHQIGRDNVSEEEEEEKKKKKKKREMMMQLQD
jgi:hypothetical protein